MEKKMKKAKYNAMHESLTKKVQRIRKKLIPVMS